LTLLFVIRNKLGVVTYFQLVETETLYSKCKADRWFVIEVSYSACTKRVKQRQTATGSWFTEVHTTFC